MKRSQAEALMYKTELDDVKEINARRKERDSGKRHVLKDTPVASTERIERELRKHEEARNRKKKGKGIGGRKRTKRQVVSSENEMDSSMDDISEAEEPLDLDLDCIEVA